MKRPGVRITSKPGSFASRLYGIGIISVPATQQHRSQREDREHRAEQQPHAGRVTGRRRVVRARLARADLRCRRRVPAARKNAKNISTIAAIGMVTAVSMPLPYQPVRAVSDSIVERRVRSLIATSYSG